LLTHLSVLKDAELLYERGIFPDSTYIFKHALTREVVYDSILSKRRKELHDTVALAIEHFYKSNLTEHLATLCDHFMAGEDYGKAETYARLADRKARNSGSMPDAIDQGKKRVVCLEKLPLNEENQKKIIDARTGLALHLLELNHFNDAKEAIDPIIELAQKMNYKKKLGQINTIVGTYHSQIEENYPAAFQKFETALAISEETKDIVTSSYISYWLGICLASNCEFEKASQLIQKAIDINVVAGNLWGTAAIQSTFAFACFFSNGRIIKGFEISAEAVKIAEESGDAYSKGLAYTCHGLFCYGRALFDEAEKYLLEGAFFCDRINQRTYNFIAHFFLAELNFEKGEYLEAEKWFMKAYQILKDSGMYPSLLNYAKVNLLKTKAMVTPQDLESLYDCSKINNNKGFQGSIFRDIGAVLINLGHLPEAETWIQRAIEEDKRNGTRFFLGKDYALYGEFFRQKGDRTKAQENLGRAIEIMKECGVDGWVTKYEEALAKP
jgi:tetratricopeptide (TPR) repeat protein